MNFIVYKTTNLLNGRFYVGVHNGTSTNYYGSGRLLKAAIKKYGKENFIRETLIDCGNDGEEAYSIEAMMVKTVKEDPRSYNLEAGGLGNSNLGKSVVERSIGIHAASFEDRSEWSKQNQANRDITERTEMCSIGGKRSIESGHGWQQYTPEQRLEFAKKANQTKIDNDSYCPFKDPEFQKRNGVKGGKATLGFKTYNDGVNQFSFKSSNPLDKEITTKEFSTFIMANQHFSAGRIFRARLNKQ
jgi:hypothetical protein